MTVVFQFDQLEPSVKISQMVSGNAWMIIDVLKDFIAPNSKRKSLLHSHCPTPEFTGTRTASVAPLWRNDGLGVISSPQRPGEDFRLKGRVDAKHRVVVCDCFEVRDQEVLATTCRNLAPCFEDRRSPAYTPFELTQVPCPTGVGRGSTDCRKTRPGAR
jgi:hypothetical protein